MSHLIKSSDVAVGENDPLDGYGYRTVDSTDTAVTNTIVSIGL